MSKTEHSPYIRSADDPLTLDDREPYEERNVGIYVLRCEEGKYYVGASSNVDERIDQHFDEDSKGSLWTDLYRPIEVAETHELDDELDWKHIGAFENQHTKRLMEEHGVENVRGGIWARPNIDDCPPLPDSL